MPLPETSDPGPADARDARITTWAQTCVAVFFPALVTFLVAFGVHLSNEQQLAASGFVGAVSTMALVTWRTFRGRRGDR